MTFKLITGVVEVIAIGDWQRLLNLCKTKNIKIWNIERQNKDCSFWLGARDFLGIKELCKKCGVKLIIKSKHGLPFILKKYYINYSFVLGIVLAFTLVETLSLYVWKISVDGNEFYTYTTIIDYLKTQNVSVGCRMDEIICDDIEKNIRNDFSDVTWVSVEKKGTCLCVHIKENDGDVKVSKSNNPTDIIATQNGIVVDMVTRSGQPMVKIGDEVNEGDVLVSGEIILYDDAKNIIGHRYVPSDADIFVKTTMSYDDLIDRKYSCKIYTGKTNEGRSISFFGHQMSVLLEYPTMDQFDVVTERQSVKLTKNIKLPFFMDKVSRFEYELRDENYTDDELRKILTDNFDNFIEKLQKKGVQIIDNSVKISLSDVKGTMSGELEIIMPMNKHVDTSIKDIENMPTEQ